MPFAVGVGLAANSVAHCAILAVHLGSGHDIFLRRGGYRDVLWSLMLDARLQGHRCEAFLQGQRRTGGGNRRVSRPNVKERTSWEQKYSDNKADDQASQSPFHKS
jgi:hypothetical protein